MNQIEAILYRHLLAFLSSTALLSMAANAVINTAPAALPSWRDLPQWVWSWAIGAARQFWSLHHPGQAQPQFPNQPAQPGQKEKA